MTSASNSFTVCKTGPSLQAIDKASVHKICSGQVIVSVASAVKELVENSLDAGSSSIEVRLRDYGAEIIEVVDNGCGVLEENFQGLTLKHHTSKLKEFQDIVDLETFGFRGEALSSLCALSQVSIITFHRNSPSAFKLEYDNQGTLVKKTPCSRQIGTTVTIRNIFSTLPVRRKEFLKNTKRDFAKMLNVLYAYCLGSPSVRISCSNQVGAVKNTVVSTQNGSGVTDNIACIFGQKQLSSLMEFRCQPPDPETLAEYALERISVDLDSFDVHGYVSSCDPGSGRGAPDRQFYFINRRPCDPARLARVVNEVYHSFSRGRYPFVYMDVTLKKDSVDVNVTPDKRQIFTDGEKILLAVVKSSLMAMYGSVTSAIGPAISSPLTNSSVGSAFASPVSSSAGDERQDRSTPKASQLPQNLQHLKRTFSFVDPANKFPRNVTPTQKQPRLESFAFKCSSRKASPDRTTNFDLDDSFNALGGTKMVDDIVNETESTHALERSASSAVDIPPSVGRTLPPVDEDSASSDRPLFATPPKPLWTSAPGDDVVPANRTDACEDSEEEVIVDTTNDDFHRRRVVVVPFSLAELTTRLRSRCTHPADAADSARRFRAKISPSDNSSAEEELTRQIHKSTFARMEVVGQFNLGFIVTRFESDLFVIDQHASDEKYNFENLQRSDVPKTQQLIAPLPLQLTAVHETILRDNLDVFLRNGFRFDLGEEGEGRGVSLVSAPVSRNWAFGKSDVDEMLFLLGDSPTGTTCRPSRMRQMYASRACRKSVMIGTALKLSEMKRLVLHMGEMDKPWTCPHGRPTMRHLVNLELVKMT